jgi:hypothetical protein
MPGTPHTPSQSEPTNTVINVSPEFQNDNAFAEAELRLEKLCQKKPTSLIHRKWENKISMEAYKTSECDVLHIGHLLITNS